MKRLTLSLARLSFAALLISCGVSATPTAQAQEGNLLVATTGTVRLKRTGWKDFVSAPAGVLLYPNDLLDVQGSATVLCAGLVVKVVTTLTKTPCSEERGSYMYDGQRFSSGQRGIPKDIPYIVYPRNTLVLDAHPMLIWHATNAAQYAVSLVDGNGKTVWQQQNVRGTAIQYPGSAPVLRPGIDYLLVVQDDHGKTSEGDPEKGLGFRLLSAANRPAVEQQRKAILALESLDETGRKLALAVYYATWSGEDGRGLWGEAWLLLEQVAKTRDTAAIRLWMGDMLRAIRLADEAVVAYQQALQQAEAAGDRASQAAAQTGVWRVTGEQTRLEAAIKLYQELGDQREVDALRKASTP